ncbi:MAG: histidine--tRNA ligase [Cytophagales bacterium]
MQKPSLPRGTRDFGPETMSKRSYMFAIIKNVFEKFGFQPLETPSMENLEVLTGKYGDEGDQLIFKVLNSGNYLDGVDEDLLKKENTKKLTPKIAEKALRYDLTVPFARYVVMNKATLSFPFKRFQIQPVWRADRPQKGRYREFYQCDADVVGTDSLLCEWEAFQMIDEVLATFGLASFTIKFNHRAVLSAMSEYVGLKGREMDLCVAIDKLDKVGNEAVNNELSQKGFPHDTLKLLSPFFEEKQDLNTKITHLESLIGQFENGKRALADLSQLSKLLETKNLKKATLQLDCSLARGMGYYTGCIWEVKANQVSMGSICGGGRYDNLTGVFGLEGVSGVGFSFGVERIFDVLEELNLFPSDQSVSTQLLITSFDEESFLYALDLLDFFRSNNIKTELYPEPTKIKKQFTYADNRKIPFVLVIGSDEMSTGNLTVKNLKTGEQIKKTREEVLIALKNVTL